MAHKRKFFDPRYHAQEKRMASVAACIIFWSVLSYGVISRHVVGSAEVIGDSMRPSLADGDRVILNRLVYQLEPPRRGDVVAVDVPGYDGMSVKRVIALPGETVQIRDNMVFVNGSPLNEPYLAGRVHTHPGALTSDVYRVDASCYFVLGDNREDSVDSRRFGAVRREWIYGRVAGTEEVPYKF
jgi:signal peptidase I